MFRKVHEKGLLQRMNDIEEKLGNHLTGLNKSIEDAKNNRDTKPPQIDMEGVRLKTKTLAMDAMLLGKIGYELLAEKGDGGDRSGQE